MDIITKEQIDAWKKEHGPIFKVTPLEGLDIIYKPLNRDTYMEIMANNVSGDPEIETLKLCIINDIDLTLLVSRAGIATVVYEQIMMKSGFVVVESEEL